MEQLTTETFIEKVFDFEASEIWNFKGNKPAIIDFYADWCGPCKMISPIMTELSKEFEGKLDVYKINTDEEEVISEIFNIKSIPAVLIIPKDADPRFVIGAYPKEAYLDAIKDIIGLIKE